MSRVDERQRAGYELLPFPLSPLLPVLVPSMLRRMVFQGNMSPGVFKSSLALVSEQENLNGHAVNRRRR